MTDSCEITCDVPVKLLFDNDNERNCEIVDEETYSDRNNKVNTISMAKILFKREFKVELNLVVGYVTERDQ
eukprot:snap_masked-scaffold_3-processed-gene-20.2-mRNA-1 protein AED:1.00 eAED:1.00 QI:0/-1/0/0/-1/1/1/0/70